MLRIIISHNTLMWNEGFEYAQNPQVALYTDNIEVLPIIAQIVEAKNSVSDGGSTFYIETNDMEVDYEALNALALARPNEDDKYALEDYDYFNGWELGVQEGSTAEIVANVTNRLNEWQGL